MWPILSNLLQSTVKGNPCTTFNIISMRKSLLCNWKTRVTFTTHLLVNFRDRRVDRLALLWQRCKAMWVLNFPSETSRSSERTVRGCTLYIPFWAIYHFPLLVEFVFVFFFKRPFYFKKLRKKETSFIKQILCHILSLHLIDF